MNGVLLKSQQIFLVLIDFTIILKLFSIDDSCLFKCNLIEKNLEFFDSPFRKIMTCHFSNSKKKFPIVDIKYAKIIQLSNF